MPCCITETGQPTLPPPSLRRGRTRLHGLAAATFSVPALAVAFSLAACASPEAPACQTAVEPPECDCLAPDLGPPPPGALSKVGGRYVTSEDLAIDTSRLSSLVQADATSAEGRELLLTVIEDRLLLEQEARRRGLHRLPEVKQPVERAEQRLLVQALLRQLETAMPTEDQLRAEYAAHPDRYVVQPAAKVDQILVARPAKADRARDDAARSRAHGLLARLKDGDAFERVAAEGDGPEANVGGRLGWLEANTKRVPAEVVGAALTTVPVGSRSAIIETPTGFHIIRVAERRAKVALDFEGARTAVLAHVSQTLERESFEALTKRLRLESPVERFEREARQ